MNDSSEDQKIMHCPEVFIRPGEKYQESFRERSQKVKEGDRLTLKVYHMIKIG